MISLLKTHRFSNPMRFSGVIGLHVGYT